MKNIKMSGAMAFIIDHRWRLGFLALLLVIILQLNGSSLGSWNVVMGGGYERNGILLGKNRHIRSDEWCVFTPMAMSQYYNDFNYESDIIRGTNTDMYMVYGQPVRDWTVAFRPFQIGYLFLSPGRGLAFYWYGKIIFFLLVSFEFGLLITNRNKSLSLVYSLMTTFAPVVQWWFSTNAFPDMLVYGQGILIFLNAYMQTTSYRKRLLYSIGMCWMMGAYLLVLYPAWQIPFFYAFFVVGLWIIISRWKEFNFSWKKDIVILLFSLALLCITLVCIMIRSRDAISAVMNSVYPGSRLETGGDGFPLLFRYVGNLLFPYTELNVPGNVCESAAFYDLFPLGLLLSVWLMRRNRDPLTIWLLGSGILLGLYIVVGFPEFLARLSLLSNVLTGRGAVALSYINLLLIIRAASLWYERQAGQAGQEEERNRNRGCWKYVVRLLLLGLLAAAAFLAAWWLLYRSYFTLTAGFVCFIVLLAVFLCFGWKEKAFCILLCMATIIMGATINPVRIGVTNIADHPLGMAIRDIISQDHTDRINDRDDKNRWITVSDKWQAGDFPIMYGAPALNCTNTYVNRELWDAIDPDRQYDEVYNRYAHFLVSLKKSGSPDIELLYPDQIRLTIAAEELPGLGVRYVVSDQELSIYNSEKIIFQPVYQEAGVNYRIFQIESP